LGRGRGDIADVGPGWARRGCAGVREGGRRQLAGRTRRRLAGTAAGELMLDGGAELLVLAGEKLV
jgi:hypothetical protein